jgi:hypothetical protein
MDTPSTTSINPDDLKATADRLRRQRWPEREGHRQGVEYALKSASFEAIQWWVQAATTGGDLVQHLHDWRPHFAEEWADDFEGLDENRFFEGFAAGVVQVWRQVEAEVEAV